MKLVLFNEEERENHKRSDVIKKFLLKLAPFIGFILSSVLAYAYIDFEKFSKIFNDNIFNPKFNEFEQILGKWFMISIGILLVAIPSAIIYHVCKEKNDDKDANTWGRQ